MDAEQHLLKFATTFVLAARRDRWIELLTRRDKKTYDNSSKLMQALDGRYCTRVDGVWDLPPSQLGVFYDFREEPTIMTLAEAAMMGESRDAVFSIEAGRLAIHFSHEGWSWLCRR